MKFHLSLLCVVSVAAVPCAFAQPTIEFGQNAIQGVPNPGSTATVEMTEDSAKISGPNFWSIQGRFENTGFTFEEVADDQFLEVTIRGSAPDAGAFLRAVLHTPDWSQKFIYDFNLADLNPDEFVTIRSTTPLSQPVPPKADAEAAPPAPGTAINTLLLLTGAQQGNAPWDIEIKNLGVATGENP